MNEQEHSNQFRAETAVIGSIFLDNSLIDETQLSENHLVNTSHKIIFEAMKKLNKDNKACDVMTVANQLGDSLLEVGGFSFLSQLVQGTPTSANFKYYEEIILHSFKKRCALDAAQRLIIDIQSGAIAVDDAVNQGLNNLSTVFENNQSSETSLLDHLTEVYEDLNRVYDGINGVSTGYSELDLLLDGLHSQDFCIIGARPSVGKTAFALNIANKIAEKHIAAFFSLEMSAKELVKRMIAMEGNINAHKIRNARARFDEDDWSRTSSAISKIQSKGLVIFDKPAIDINYIRMELKKLRKKYPDRKIVVFIDYLQMIRGSAQHRGNRNLEISEISQSLKILARELDVNITALSQLSRNVESRQDKRPMMSDLRESGQIEQDADVIGFLYRDDYYDIESDQKDIIEVIIAKQRNGATGTIKLAFVKQYGKFVNIVSSK